MSKYTEKAVEVFLETGTRFPRSIIWAMGLLKYAAAKVNAELGLLNKDISEATMKISRELAEGLY
ncbi:MAG: fumarate hydratase, partial [Sulfolobales archaeon]